MNATSTQQYLDMVKEASDFIIGRLGTAKIALVLGSGLGPFVGYLTDVKEDVPHMPTTSVVGHDGKFMAGTVSGKRVLCLSGRIHPYEGYHMFEITFVTRCLKRLGVELFITTNSSGGCQPGMTNGCIMAIRDHMNWFKRNPLYETPDLAERHVDMRRVYSSRLLTVARRTAKAHSVQLFEGTSVTTCGPTYESFTEVSVGAKWGASAFGMSLVPESMVAYSEGLEVFGCSMITNLAAGIDDSSMKLTHEDVIGVSGAFAPSFTKFMLAFIADVQTKPPRSLVISPDALTTAPAMVGALPQRQAQAPTQAEVAEAVDFLAKRVGKMFDLEAHHPEVAVYVSYGMEDLANYLQGQKLLELIVRVPYASVPHFPSISRTGCGGEFCFGKRADGATSLLFLNGNALESYNCEEAVFVAMVLAQLGVVKLLHTFFAASSNPMVRADTVRIVGDATDFTTIAPVPHRPAQPQYMSTALFNSNPADLGDLQLAFRFAGQQETNAPLHYAHVLGPSFPTRAEMHLAILCKIDLVGITSLGLVYASRSLGIDVVGLAGVAYEAGEDPLADASYVLWRKMRNVVVALLKGSFVPKRESATHTRMRTPGAPRKLLDAPAPAPAPVEVRRAQVTYHLAAPVSQGSLGAVQASAEWLRARGFRVGAELAVVVDSRLPEMAWPGFTVVAQCQYQDVPNFPANAPGTMSLLLLPEAKKYVVVLHGTLLYNQGRTNAEIGYGVRVLQQLQVKRVVFVNEVASYSRRVPINSFVLLRDHFNLSGRNPLFGKNVPEFGLRFPDLGNLYTDTLRQGLRRCAQQMDLNFAEAACCFVVGPVFASLADAAIVQACDCQVSCTGMVPEVLVARHAGIPLAAIGVVKAQVVEGELFLHSTKFKKSDQRDLLALLTSLLERV